MIARWLKIAGGVLAGIVGLAAVGLIGLVIALERGWLNNTIEDAVSAQLGRRVNLEGGIDVGFGRELSLALGPLTVANPDWAPRPDMARVERVEVSLRLPALLRGDIILPRVFVDRPTAALLRAADGRANWLLDRPAPAEPTPVAQTEGLPRLPEIRELLIQGIAVDFADEAKQQRWSAAIPRLAGSLGGDLPTEIEGQGTLADQPLRVFLHTGPLTTADGQGEPMPFLAGLDVGSTRSRLEGTLGSSANLATLDASAALQTGPTTLALLRSLGVALDVLPPLAARLRIVPRDGRSQVELEGDAAGQQLRALGLFDLADPLHDSVVTLALGSERPGDLLTSLGGSAPDGLPAYLAAATIRGEASALVIQELGVRFGANWAQGNGRIDDLATLSGLELHLEGALPELRLLADALALPQRDIPLLAFKADANRRADQNEVHLTADLGGDRLDLQAKTAGPLAELRDLALKVSAQGSHLADFMALAGLEGRGALPNYALEADIERLGGGWRVQQLVAQLGENRLQGQGAIADITKLEGLEAHVEADLPRLTEIARHFQLTDKTIPDFSLVADAKRNAESNDIALDASFGTDRIELRAANRGAFSDLSTLRLEAQARGTNLGQFLPLLGLTEQPVPSYRLDAVVARQEDGHTALDLAAALGTTELTAKGMIADITTGNGVDLEAGAKGEDPSKILEIFGLPGIPLPPFNVTAHLNRDGQVIEVRNLAGTVGDSDIRGKAGVDLGHQPPAVTADLVSNRLDFDDLAGLIGAPPDTSERASPEQRKAAAELAAEQRILPDVKVNFAALKKLNLDVHFKGTQVNAPNLPIQDVAFHIVARDGRLMIEPFEATVARGKVRVIGNLQDAGRAPRGTFDVRVNGLKLQEFLGKFGVGDHGLGTFTGRAQLTAEGNSVREMAATADGRLALVMENGRIDSVLMEAAGLDITESVGVLFFDNDEDPGVERVELRCAIGEFALKRGVMQIQTVLLDTPDDKLTVEGSINLRDETLDLIAHAIPRDPSIGSSRMPIHLEGKLRAPAVTPAPGGIKNTIIGWALAPLAALVPFVELGSEDEHPCAGVVQRVTEEAKSRG